MSRVQTVTKALGFLLVVYCSVVHLASGVCTMYIRSLYHWKLDKRTNDVAIVVKPQLLVDVSCFLITIHSQKAIVDTSSLDPYQLSVLKPIRIFYKLLSYLSSVSRLRKLIIPWHCCFCLSCCVLEFYCPVYIIIYVYRSECNSVRD